MISMRPFAAEERKVMSDLAEKECVACKTGSPPPRGDDLARLTRELAAGWRVVNEHRLERDYKFANFVEALAFTNKIGGLAETQNHHPDICLAWGKVKLTLWTHTVDGLTESDFVFAAKVDKLTATP
jgi:4a-hydroxytetrahydrobiopterin dehydratase